MKTMFYSLYARNTKRFFFCTSLLAILFVGAANLSAQNQGCTLVCPPMDPPVPVSLSENCADTLTSELLGVLPSAGCVGPFGVEIMNDQGMSLGNMVDITMVGETFMVVVTSEAPEDNAQACMFTLTVVDKMLPIVTCPDDVTVTCTTPLDSVPGIVDSNVIDCSPFEIYAVNELIFSDGCPDSIITKYMRTYYVEDIYGNVTTCTQMVSFRQVPLGDVDFPADVKGPDAIPCTPGPDLSPEITGEPTVDGNPIDNSNSCNVLVGFEDTDTIPICSGGYKLLRRWTVMDWCNNTSTQTVQVIEVKDFTPPVVEVPEELNIEAGPGCVADALLPQAVVTEDCSTIWTVRMQGPFGTIQQNGGLIEDLPLGSFDVIYIATTDCGLVGRDTLTVTIADESGPSAVCHAAVTVPLNSMGMTVAPAESFNAGSFDNCGPIYFKAKRMSSPDGYDCFAGDNDQYAFDDVVKFCCEDVENGPIMVIMRVYDVPVVPGTVSDSYQQGRYSDCMVSVEVQDKVGPAIICPPDLTISCMYPFDPNNLSVFGTIVSDPADREDVCIDDPGDNDPNPVCWGPEGLATDNCSVRISENMAMIMDSLCGTGRIERTFTATDPGGRSVSCMQTITIQNFNPFTEGQIIWPQDLITEDICDIDALDPEDLNQPYSMPILLADECDIVVANPVDEVLDFSGSSEACFKILRTWTVIDWCQYSATNGQTGRWTHLQVIKVKNTNPPTFISSGEDMTLCAADPGCGDAIATLEASADDDCTNPETFRWRISIDLDNNGTIDDFVQPNIGQSVTEQYAFPIGTHRVLYAVQDFCSNTTVEEQIITVESCAVPSAKCQSITVTLMPVQDGGSMTIWASDLDAGSDHPCGLDVTVAFSPDPTNTNLTFTCDDLGPNDVDLYVIDETGATDFCTVVVTVQDNGGVCSGGLTGTIGGSVMSSSALEMNDVVINLNGSGLDPVHSDKGHYDFPAMPLGGAYEVEPVLDADPTNGISTIDLIQIQKHLLGIQELGSPYKMIAADANNSGSVSAVDILELKKLILGITDELPNNTSWRFVDAAYQFIDPLSPFNEEIPESYKIDPFADDMHNIDFVGIKVGDVNESAQVLRGEQTGLVSGAGSTSLNIEDVYLSAGEIREVMVNAESLSQLATLQFTMGWDRTRIDVMEVIPGRRANTDQWNDAALDRGTLPFSWHQLEVPDTETEELITLRIRAVRSGMLSDALRLTSEVAAEEAMTEEGRIVIPEIQFVQDVSASTFKLHQNIPNPFTESTSIPFDLEEEGKAELLIYDVLGKVLYSQTVDAVAGRNLIQVPASSIQANGLLIYSLKVGDSQQTKRMIIEQK